jgi:hypothetical protein
VISTIGVEVIYRKDSALDEDSEYSFNFEEGRSQEEFRADEALVDCLPEAPRDPEEAFYDDRTQKYSSLDDYEASQKVNRS